ncbi:MAG: hypothetical protein J7D61_17105, partial [Marichromatium sp.]|nr:hypothetical protein [Marichromatium sp.]
QAAVDAGTFTSGYEHFVLFGAAEGRASGGSETPTSGETFTLTNSAITGNFDNIEGTSGNDVFDAGPGFLETGDNLNGAAGTDVLNARLTDGQTTAPTISSIENIFVRVDGADNGGAGATTATFSMADVSGAEQVWADRVTSADTNATNTFAVSGTGLTTDVTVGIKGGATAAANRADATFTFSGVTGTADEATLALDGASINDVNIAGIETLNVATQGDASLIDGTLNAAAASNIVFTGDANATIDATDFANTGYAVDASALTGDLNITLEDQTSGNTSFTGGAGDDRVSLAAGLDANDTIDGGEGTNTVNVTVATDLTAATGAKLSNFQVFDAAGAAAGTYDMDHIDGGGSASTIEALSVSADLGGATVIDNLAAGADVTIGATTTAALTVNQKDAGAAGSNDDVLNYELTGAANITAASLVAANVETVNITSTATTGATTGHTITATTFANAETVAFSGDEQLTVTTLGAVSATKIDASAMSDSFIMTNASDAATILLLEGGAADDTLIVDENVQLANSVIQGNGGADSISITDGGGNTINTIVKYAAQADSTGSSFDNITGFVNAAQDAGAGDADTIDLSAFGFSGAQASVLSVDGIVTVDNVSNSFTISSANAANFFNDAGVDRAVGYASDGTDSFLFVDANKDGDWSADTDMAIQLTGVDADTNAFANGDFTFA